MAPRKDAVVPKKRVGPRAHKLPEAIKEGEVLTDVGNQKWKIGKSIGIGGFGEIYLASKEINEPVLENASYVVKIEPHKNGPLFVEINFYIRIGKPNIIEKWVSSKRLKTLGMPRFIGSGSHEYKNNKYRFLVMERFGDDVWKLFESLKRRLDLKTIYTLGIKILDVVEYIHSNEYVHADIKGSNLLIGYEKGTENDVYLVDYGLACKYASGGVHKECKPDARKAHNGTIEYTSRDAHIGVTSRRGDFEILGYNLLQWACGHLPWEDNLGNPEYVHLQKKGFMSNIPGLMRSSFPDGNIPGALERYLKYAASLQFSAIPDYDQCRKILREGITDLGLKDDGKLCFTKEPIKSPKVKKAKYKCEAENEGQPKMKKPPKNVYSPRVSARTLRSPNRITRNSPPMLVLRSQQNLFWNDPEKPLKKKTTKKFHHMSAPDLRMTASSQVNTSATKLDMSLDNPTPAMLELKAKIYNNSINKTLVYMGKRSTKNMPLVSCNSEVGSSGGNMTPAMELIQKRLVERSASGPSSVSSNGYDDDNSNHSTSVIPGKPKMVGRKLTLKKTKAQAAVTSLREAVPDNKRKVVGSPTQRKRSATPNKNEGPSSPKARVLRSFASGSPDSL